MALEFELDGGGFRLLLVSDDEEAGCERYDSEGGDNGPNEYECYRPEGWPLHGEL
jgi:hypothetical protein